jgi:hypothetical protein
LGSKEYLELRNQMLKLSGSMEIPKGIERVRRKK